MPQTNRVDKYKLNWQEGKVMFATRFWSTNYEEGLDTLFGKLSQGIVENQELLAAAKARADAEAAHGAKLAAMSASLEPKKNGFAKDDGASMRKAYEGILQQLADEAKQHTHISTSIKNMVIDPFSKWSQSHQQRVSASQAELQRLLKVYSGDLQGMTRAQHRYFNRCRLDEDNAGLSPSSSHTSDSTQLNAPRARSMSTASNGSQQIPSGSGSGSGSGPTSEELVIGGRHYTADESQELVKRMLGEIPQKSTYVKILGTYDNTITGAQLTEWLIQNSAANVLALAEESGQMLVSRGFLRLVGQMGSRFVNSSVFIYQWRPRAYEFAGLTATVSTFSDLAERWARNTVAAGGDAGGDENGPSVRELDQKYRKSVDALERARLELEATMVEHLSYLEKCERERLAAFKAVMLDFSAAISNIVPALSAGVDKLLLYHEAADVDRDLRFLIENYQTGKYAPRVFVYDNYYSSTDGAAVFGLDLELRARADKKKVPLIVAQILGALDSKYPKMDNDKERLALWRRPLHIDLRVAQKTRQELNSLSANTRALAMPGNANIGAQHEHIQMVFERLAPLALVQALKLYFLELPISVVGGQLYDILKGVYARYGEDQEARVQALQNTLGQLTITHIATLDALTSHIFRLITIAKATEDDVNAIANEWGGALCRPKSESVLAINDVFPALILRDLLQDRDRVFGELKRQQSSRSVSHRRPRQASTPDVSKLVLTSDRTNSDRTNSDRTNSSRASSFEAQKDRSSSPPTTQVAPDVPGLPSTHTLASTSAEHLSDIRPPVLDLAKSGVDFEGDSFADAQSNSPGITSHPTILPQ